MNNNLPSEAVAHAVAVLKNEHVIAYPTEAVFGVGCDPDSETAVMRLLELKQRPVEKGLILIAASFEQLKPYIDDSRLSDSQWEAIFSCWPGPVKNCRQYRKNLYLWFEQQLAAGPWALGASITLLDCYIAAMYRWGPRQAWFDDHAPKFAAIARAVCQRPELAAALRRNKLI